MRKILMTMLVTLMMVTAGFAQNTDYNEDYGYSFFSGWGIGASVDASKTIDFSNWTPGSGLSFGADVRFTKQIYKNWTMRFIADVPGFLTKPVIETGMSTQYDRYGKLTAGLQWNFVPWMYIFGDLGGSCNPSAPSKFGLAGQAGLGWCTTGKTGKAFIEIGADCTQNVPTPWNFNHFAKVGYVFNLGITERDRKNLSIIEHQPDVLAGLERDNQQLKSEVLELTKANTDQASTLSRITAQNENLENELTECRMSSIVSTDFQLVAVYFEYASYEVTPSTVTLLRPVAERISADNAIYLLDGYCSNDGDDYTNMILSEQRANAVKETLVDLGVPANRLMTAGHGKTTSYGDRKENNRLVTITRQ